MADSLQALTTRLSAATKAATAEIADLRQRIVTAQQQLQAAQQQLVPIEELEARATQAVREAGAHWLSKHGRTLVTNLGAPGKWSLRGVHHGVDVLSWGACCAAEPDVAVARLLALARQVPYEAGRPSADRPALVTRLTRELATLEGAEETAIDAAQAAGLSIAHRPEVTTRRADAARRRELEEERAAERRQRQAALDASYVRKTRQVLLDVPPRTGRSSYIESSGKLR